MLNSSVVQYPEMATIEDLLKLDIRVGTITQVETIEGSEKLYKETVDFGPEIGERQILSGIRKSFMPEDLVGKQTLFIVNLEPREIMGFESQGMLLATDNEDGIVLLVPGTKTSNGSKIH